MEVKARAPGKIILAGEHAVVHGSTVVAACIDLYTCVSLHSSLSENDDTLKLHLKDMELDFSWSVGRIKDKLSHLGGPFPLTPTTCSTESIKCIVALVEEQNIPEAKIGLATGVSAFLWLYASIQGFKPATVVVTSDLPGGAGLGSSAAICVALSAALLGFSDSVSLDKNHEGWFTYGQSELDLLNKWAFEGEKLIHGKPSGLDNTVSTYVRNWLPICPHNIEVRIGFQVDRSWGWWLCADTIANIVLSGTIVDKVTAELESCGFQCFMAGIGGNGVEISFHKST